MARHSQHRNPRLGALAARLDRAAEALNPFLVVIAIGLIVLNLISLAMLAPYRSAARLGNGRAPGAAPAAAPPRLGGLQ